MPPQKLSDSDKQNILVLYRQTEETTSTLANRYGVSNTTISRILKQGLSEQEYEILMQQKRTGVLKPITASSAPETVDINSTLSDAAFEVLQIPDVSSHFPEIHSSPPAPLRRRRRSTLEDAEAQTLELLTEPMSEPFEPRVETQLPLLELPVVTKAVDIPVSKTPDMLEEGLLDSEEEFADMDDEDDESDENDEDDDLDDDSDAEGDLAAIQIQSTTVIRVLPLSEASIPKICYLVVDRASELITRPLRDFAELGQIPVDEIQAKTLPVFDNHRVARRFSRRMQRVVKVPDGKVLQKVSVYLQAKGITRLLIDGKVYSI
jgi:transposase-like protein